MLIFPRKKYGFPRVTNLKMDQSKARFLESIEYSLSIIKLISRPDYSDITVERRKFYNIASYSTTMSSQKSSALKLIYPWPFINFCVFLFHSIPLHS